MDHCAGISIKIGTSQLPGHQKNDIYFCYYCLQENVPCIYFFKPFTVCIFYDAGGYNDFCKCPFYQSPLLPFCMSILKYFTLKIYLCRGFRADSSSVFKDVSILMQCNFKKIFVDKPYICFLKLLVLKFDHIKVLFSN